MSDRGFMMAVILVYKIAGLPKCYWSNFRLFSLLPPVLPEMLIFIQFFYYLPQRTDPILGAIFTIRAKTVITTFVPYQSFQAPFHKFFKHSSHFFLLKFKFFVTRLQQRHSASQHFTILISSGVSPVSSY